MKHAINLIPSSVLERRARRRRLRAWLAGHASLLALGAVVLALAHPEASGRVDRLRGEYESARTALAQEQERLTLASAQLRQAKAREAVERRMGARPDFSGLMQVLGEQIDTRAFLEQVIIAPVSPEAAAPPARAAGPTRSAPGQPAGIRPTEYQVLVSGVAVNMAVVNELVLKLDRTGYFSDVWPASTGARRVGGVEGVEFRIVATLGQGLLAEVSAGRSQGGTP